MEDSDAPLYYAKDGLVWKRPIQRPNANGGTNITMGFPVCRMHEGVGDEAAQSVAELMNLGEAFQKQKEPT